MSLIVFKNNINLRNEYYLKKKNKYEKIIYSKNYVISKK